MHAQWSSPAYGVVNGQPQVIFPGGDGWIYSFAPNGELLWKFDCNPKDTIFLIGRKNTRNQIVATPVIHNGRVHIGVGDDPEHEGGVGHLWCIDMSKRGDVSPEIVTDAGVYPPKTIPNSNSANVWHYGGAISNKQEIQKLKRSYYFSRTLSTCAIHDGLVYTADVDGFLYCLDAETGKVQWTHETECQIWSSPYWVDGKIYLANDNEVHVFQHGRQKKLLSRFEIQSPVRGQLAANNGVLYLRGDQELFAIATDK